MVASLRLVNDLSDGERALVSPESCGPRGLSVLKELPIDGSGH